MKLVLTKCIELLANAKERAGNLDNIYEVVSCAFLIQEAQKFVDENRIVEAMRHYEIISSK